MLAPQGLRTLEEAFGDNREELGPIRRPIMVQQRLFAPPRLADQPAVLRLGHLIPGRLLVAVLQRRRAVDRTVESVEVMGELVQDNVVAVGLVTAGRQDGPPRKDDRAVVPGLAQQAGRQARIPPELTRVHVDARIENDRCNRSKK